MILYHEQFLKIETMALAGHSDGVIADSIGCAKDRVTAVRIDKRIIGRTLSERAINARKREPRGEAA